MRARLALVSLCLLAGACQPARRREGARTLSAFAVPAAGTAAAPVAVLPQGAPPATPNGPPPAEVAAALAADPFFAGRRDLLPFLDVVAPTAPPRGTPISSTRLPAAEAAVLRDAIAAGRGDVRSLFVYGVSFRVSCSPSRAAAVLLDPATEKLSFGAQEGADLGPPAAGEGRRMSFGLLDMGEKPFTYDFRFALEGRRQARPGGRHVVRYDMLSDPAPQRVSMVGGAAVLDPDGDGTRVTEVLAIGSPVSTPFFLKGKARAAVERILSTRANRLAEAMNGK